MVVLIMTNVEMGISCFERNGIFTSNCGSKRFSLCEFPNSQRPISGVGLNMMSAKNIHIFGLRALNYRTINALSKGDSDNRWVGGGTLEKEFEFKRSFDEYLKAMESVKTGRDKKQIHKSNRYKSKDGLRENDVLRMPSLGRDDGNVKLRKFEGYSDQEKMSKVKERDDLSVNGNVVSKRVVVKGKIDYKERGIRKSKDKLDCKDSSGDAKGKRRLGGETMYRRWFDNQPSSVELELEDSNFTKSIKARNENESPMVLDNDKNTCRVINIEGKLGHDNSMGMLERKVKSFGTEEIGVGSYEMCGRLVRNHIQVEKVSDRDILQNKGKLTRRNDTFLEKGDYNGWEVERAALKTFEESNDVIDKPRVSQMEMEERIQKLAKWLNGADIDMPEWMFSKMMRSAKIRFSDHSILRVIQLLGKLGNWRRVLQVIEWLQMRERFKSHRLRYIYTAALGVLGKARRPVEAINVFHAMQQQMSSYPDVVAYHSIAITLGQAGHMKELFDVIDSMRSPPKKKFKTGVLSNWDPQLEPDIVVYNAVLNACVRRKHWEGAFWVLQQLKQQGQRPSSTTYGLVMEVMLACGKYNLVHEFFRKVQKSSIPNALAYKVLVNTLWKEGKTDEAVLAVQDMERRGIVGSAALYYDLARCLCSAGRCQEALMQIEKICKVANKPLVVTYTGLIQACLDSGNIQNGAYIFNHMNDFCSPNLVTCNIMLKAFLEHGLFEEARKLFQKMSEDGNHISNKSDHKVRVMPDNYTFNTMLDACIAEKRWNDFEYVYRRMLLHGYHFNAKRHLRMILDASRAGKEELLETTWKHLARADRVPPAPLLKERFCMKLEKEDYISALSCIPNHPVSELQAFSKSAWLNLFRDNAHRFGKDTLVRLIDEVSILISRSDSPNLVLQNLLSSCKEFLRTGMILAGINSTESICKVQSEKQL